MLAWQGGERQAERMIALLLAAAAPQPSPPAFVRKVGFWTIERDSDFCSASSGFGQNYLLTVALNKEGRTVVGVTSNLWTWPDGTKLNTAVELASMIYSGGDTTVVVEDSGRTLVTAMSGSFIESFRLAKGLKFYDDADRRKAGAAPLVNLTFEDNGPVTDALKACAAGSPAAAGTNPTPVAPPAPPKPAPSVMVTPPVYLNKARVIRAEDYPTDAVGSHVQGTTYYRVFVSQAGAPTGCTVTTSSGYTSLDNRACALIMERARFAPAKDAQGRPVSGTLDARVFWQAP